MRDRGWFRWTMLGVILVGTGLGLYQLAADSLWLDEILTAQFVQEPSFSAVLKNLMRWPNRPLHIAIIYGITALGNDEFWLRLPSVVFGILSLAITYKVGQVLFSRRVGLVGAFLLALSPFHIAYSQEARSYALFMLLSILSLYVILRACREGRWYWWAGFAAVSILNVYTHYFSFFVLAAELMVAGLLWLAELVSQQRSADQPGIALGARERWQLVGLVASVVAIGLAFVPSLPHLRAYLTRVGAGEGSASGLGLTPQFFLSILGQLSGGVGMDIPANTWLFGSLFVLGLVASGLQRRGRAMLWILVWLVLPFVVLFAVPSRQAFHIRYLIFILPVFLLVVAQGIIETGKHCTALLGRWRILGRFQADALRGAASVLVFVGLGALAVGPLAGYYAEEKEDWRSATEYLKARVQPGDLIVCDGIRHLSGADGFRAFTAMGYYFPEAFQNNVVIQQNDTSKTVKAMAGEHRGVWGLVFGGVPEWEPSTEIATAAKFKWVTVIHIEGGDGTALNGAIRLMQSLLGFLKGSARYEVYLELGRLFSLQGAVKRAHVQYDKAVDVAPTARDAVRTLQEHGDLYSGEGDCTNAIASYLEAIDRNPGNAGIYAKLAEVYQLAGETDKAITACEQAVALDAQTPNTALRQASSYCLSVLGNREIQP